MPKEIFLLHYFSKIEKKRKEKECQLQTQGSKGETRCRGGNLLYNEAKDLTQHVDT